MVTHVDQKGLMVLQDQTGTIDAGMAVREATKRPGYVLFAQFS